MLKNHRTVFLVVVLSISVFFNLIQALLAYAPPIKEEKSIIGTYCTENGTTEVMYLVFTRDNTYCYYRPGEILQQGAYQMEKEDIFTLETTSGKNNFGKVLYLQDKQVAYLFENKETIIKLLKIGDIPYYNSVSPTDSTDDQIDFSSQ